MSHLCYSLTLLSREQSQAEAAQAPTSPSIAPSIVLDCILLPTPASQSCCRQVQLRNRVRLLRWTDCLPQFLGIPFSLLLESSVVDLTSLESTFIVLRQWKTTVPEREKAMTIHEK